MLGLFQSAQARLLRKRKALLENAKLVLEARKIGFRENAISKLTFLYPDVQFAANLQSDEFAAYSKEKNELKIGYFMDNHLPSLLELEESLERENFEALVQSFLSEVKYYSPSSRPYSFDRNSNRAKVGYEINPINRNGACAFEIKLHKNDEIIGRTSQFYPKPEGYLAEKVYEHVVQDLAGSGVSKFTIDIGVSPFGTCDPDYRCQINYFYLDHPRRAESQSRDHYLRVCSQFLPFLNAIEQHVLDSSDVEFMYVQEDPDGLNDREIGLK